MRPDTSNTESDAAHFAAIAGRDEDFGGGVGDQEVSPLDRVDAQTGGPSLWEPWTCPRCGSIDSGGLPEKCDGCGLRNYGGER
jgi:hypothetical protein